MSPIDLSRKIGFSQIKGMNVLTVSELSERVGGVNAFFELPTKELWNKIGSQKSFCSDNSRRALLEIGSREEEFIKSAGCRGIFSLDDDYPYRLKQCDDGPGMLYVLGDCNLNSRHMVSIVGTRQATAYGQQMTEEIVERLADQIDDIVIVSGLAYGIDVAAHKAALRCGIPTVAVVAHGLRTIYPADHREVAAKIVKQGGAIVTEYISTAPVHKGNFLARNRIVAGLSDATIIVESAEKGGAMVTASIAAAYDREVFAVPGRTTDRRSAGPLKLIAANKAAMVRNADDIIDLMNWEKKSQGTKTPELPFNRSVESLGEDQKKILEYLRVQGRSTANEMSEALGMPYSILSARLMEMEMDDIVTALPGSAFAANV